MCVCVCFLLFFFIKAYFVGTHLNCIDNLIHVEFQYFLDDSENVSLILPCKLFSELDRLYHISPKYGDTIITYRTCPKI